MSVWTEVSSHLSFSTLHEIWKLQCEKSTLEVKVGLKDYHTIYQGKINVHALILTHERGQWCSVVEVDLGSGGSLASEKSCPSSDFSSQSFPSVLWHCPQIRPTQQINEQRGTDKAQLILAYSFHPCTLDAPKKNLEVWVT